MNEKEIDRLGEQLKATFTMGTLGASTPERSFLARQLVGNGDPDRDIRISEFLDNMEHSETLYGLVIKHYNRPDLKHNAPAVARGAFYKSIDDGVAARKEELGLIPPQTPPESPQDAPTAPQGLTGWLRAWLPS